MYTPFFNIINHKNMTRHFNVTTYVYDQENKKFLFMLHKKLNKWVSPGGHIDDNENPEVAAIREVKEETGVDVYLVGERYPEESDLIRPFGIQLNVIKPNEHEHFDLIYLAHPINSINTVLNKEEADDIGWFSLEEIIDPSFNSFEKNKKWCKYFDNLSKK